ncbi:MAG: peptide chain release factor-like protein [Candidatus Omnitrophica bacterium]|nr:peptide chain release factor-like protein [Candidatus Omnitrophota bacterium]
MSLFNITAQTEKFLRNKMHGLGIKESDIVERFILGQGKGGQKINKTSSCVYLKHLPTGIEVKCQQERSQSLNRFLARKLLAEKIEQMILNKKSLAQQKIEKLRRQKRKRSKRAKEKILRLKRERSEIKKSRAKPEID